VKADVEWSTICSIRDVVRKGIAVLRNVFGGGFAPEYEGRGKKRIPSVEGRADTRRMVGPVDAPQSFEQGAVFGDSARCHRMVRGVALIVLVFGLNLFLRVGYINCV